MKRKSAKILSTFCAALLTVNAAAISSFAEEKTIAPDFKKADDAVLYWADQVVEDKMNWAASPTGFTVADNGYIYISTADNILKIDKFTGEQVSAGKMAGQAMFATKGPVYADGKVFMALDGGIIQAFDADTLTSLWIYKNKNGGSPTCDIVVENGNIYTGFWNSDENDADFVKVSAADEDETSTNEDKSAEWEYTNKGGFYWTNAVVNDGTVIFGAENGSKTSSENNAPVALDDATGEKKSFAGNAHEDIRSKMVLKDGVLYYTSRSNEIFTASPEDGKGNVLDLNAELNLEGFFCTCTPIVENGRIYITINGSGWDPYNGSRIVVLDAVDDGNGGIMPKVAYTVETAAPCQAKGVFAGVDEEGYNVIYYVENGATGVVRKLRDKAGMTAPIDTVEETDLAGNKHTCPPVAFAPQGEHAQYCAVDPIYDEETGLLYIRYDSFCLLAVGEAVKFDIECPEITIHPRGVKTFVFMADENPTDQEYTVDVTNGPKKTVGDITSKDLTFSVDKLTTDDEVITASFAYGLYNGNGASAYASSDIDVLVAETEDQYKRALAKKGDVNGDGMINVTDITKLAAYVKGKKMIDKYSLNAADVNADESVNVTDIVVTAAHAKGKKMIKTER
ncbi:PQQ-binding-like beta-propeller repeat protein [Ruminococcus albus]|uniref:outer membrane protein assembly factor BamB family protein n=1 Tax=Ruminococcus albus TaxID=1264 RepID=UPI0004651EE6|nr:PQQ-binding-like beta-propeller repeat protein [Ruminococcus albus]